MKLKLKARIQSNTRDARDIEHTPFPYIENLRRTPKKIQGGSNMAESSATSLFDV